MKFALNGALTLGTLDGANVEMTEEIGMENMFIFGMNAQEVVELKQKGYNPRDYYNNDPELRRVIDAVATDMFSPKEKGIFLPIVNSLLDMGDVYCIMADFQAYLDAQLRIDQLWQNRYAWAEKSIINIARIGKFSSDRAIKEYAEDIWHIKPVQLDFP